jgi:hypothetical protein
LALADLLQLAAPPLMLHEVVEFGDELAVGRPVVIGNAFCWFDQWVSL